MSKVPVGIINRMHAEPLCCSAGAPCARHRGRWDNADIREVSVCFKADGDLARFSAAIGDAIVVSDKAGIITLWNDAAQRIFGFSSAEAVGQKLDLITPDRHRQRHWDGYAKTMATGVTRYGAELLRVPALKKDGSALSIAFTVGLLHDADGTVNSIVAVIRDETQRWTEERQMRRRVAELEKAAADHRETQIPGRS